MTMVMIMILLFLVAGVYAERVAPLVIAGLVGSIAFVLIVTYLRF